MIDKTPLRLNEPARILPSRGDAYVEIRIRRSTLIAIIVSLLVHVVVLFTLAPQLMRFGEAPVQAVEEPLEVQLNPLTPKVALNIPNNNPEPQPQAILEQARKLQPKPKPRASPPPPPASPREVIAVTKPVLNNPTVPVAPSVSVPAPVLTPNSPQPTDMMSYVNAARERRLLAQGYTAREIAEANASEHGPSADEVRDANIKRNLNPGTNGVFQIISKSSRTATFSFRGWTTDSSNSRREVIEVDAGPDGNIDRAVVRKMIELIRRYYKGDFNWESQRLDRVIILSARIEDNAGLEDFLIQEFFGAGAGLLAH
jgi:hypothetical protein